MNHNPFYNRQRISDPHYFFARNREVDVLYSAIVTHQCRSLVGERKIGKSSLLTYVGSEHGLRRYGLDPERQIVLYFDLEAMSSASPCDFWCEVLDRVSARVLDAALAEAMLKVVDEGEVRFMQVRRLLRRARDAGYEITLCLDEFEALAQNPRFETDFYGELRSLAGELGLVYLTASKRSLYEVTFEHSDTLSSPFFNIFTELPLAVLDESASEELLGGTARLAGVELCPEELRLARELGGTHPFFLQLAGFHLLETPGLGAPRTPDVTQQVRKRFLAEAEDHYRYLWAQLTLTQQMALINLSQASEHEIRVLRARNLVLEKNNRPVPFCETFAEFLQRQHTDQITLSDAGGSRAGSGSTGAGLSLSNGSGDLTGKTLGSYRVVSPLGRGGMAEVYKGYQPSLDRYVAIKILSARLASDPAFIERFQREATAVARLRHSNIVQVYDFGTLDEITYMVMEYIPGLTLKARLRDLETAPYELPAAVRLQAEINLPLASGSPGASLPPMRLSCREILSISRGVAEALDHAHAFGLVHRDVKPANILLRDPAYGACEDPAQPPDLLVRAAGAAGRSRTGGKEKETPALVTGRFTREPYAVLTDFGVVKMLEGVQFTETGTTLGTPDYMSPEQAQGANISHLSDIYSLGVVMFEMLTGRLPFTAETPVAVLIKHMTDEAPRPSSLQPALPKAVDGVMRRALAKDPSDRFHSATAFVDAVAGAMMEAADGVAASAAGGSW